MQSEVSDIGHRPPLDRHMFTGGDVHGWWPAVAAVALAVMGGAARLLHDSQDPDGDEKITGRDVLRYLITSAFFGILLVLVFDHYYDDADKLQLAVAGAAGFSAPQIATLVTVAFTQLGGLVVDKVRTLLGLGNDKGDKK